MPASDLAFFSGNGGTPPDTLTLVWNAPAGITYRISNIGPGKIEVDYGAGKTSLDAGSTIEVFTAAPTHGQPNISITFTEDSAGWYAKVS